MSQLSQLEQDPQALRQKLEAFPRVSLSTFPTPLHPARRLGQALDRDVWFKRDDISDPGLGGNKIRKLEFLLGDALKQEATAVITSGGAQSNHARITAAISARLGLECHLLLQESQTWQNSGNVTLDKLFGAKIHWHRVEKLPEIEPRAEELAAILTKQGLKPYLIPLGGSVPIGVLGYVAGFLELHQQIEALGLRPENVRIVCAIGSRGTLAGLLTAKKIINSPIRVTGVSVSGGVRWLERALPPLINETIALLGYTLDYAMTDLDVTANYIGKAYGYPTNEAWEAIGLGGQLEGIVLDPVYTGKAMAGLIGMVRSGAITKEETVIFLHTGGAPTLFAYDFPLDKDS